MVVRVRTCSRVVDKSLHEASKGSRPSLLGFRVWMLSPSRAIVQFIPPVEFPYTEISEPVT